MGETGIIRPDERVQLLAGEIIRMSPIGPNHSGVVSSLNEFFVKGLGKRAACRVQSPIAIGDRSEPEPDIALVHRRADHYRNAHPTPADVLLLIEVADTSLELDLGDKLRMYARAGILEYWVIDLSGSVMIVHRDHVGGAYTSVRECDRAASVAPAALADVVVELSEVLSF